MMRTLARARSLRDHQIVLTSFTRFKIIQKPIKQGCQTGGPQGILNFRRWRRFPEKLKTMKIIDQNRQHSLQKSKTLRTSCAGISGSTSRWCFIGPRPVLLDTFGHILLSRTGNTALLVPFVLRRCILLSENVSNERKIPGLSKYNAETAWKWRQLCIQQIFKVLNFHEVAPEVFDVSKMAHIHFEFDTPAIKSMCYAS